MTSDGGTLVYVLLHGFTGAPDSWETVRLSLTGPALALALPGHGGPDAATWEQTVDRIAEQVPPGAHLVGYSLGARVALGLLVRHPGLASRATLIGVNPGLSNADRPARQAWEEDLARMLERQGLPAFLERWERLPLWTSQQRLPDAVLARQRAIRMVHDPAGLARSLRVAGLGRMPDLRPALSTLDLPVQLVVGGEDARFRALAQDMIARLPHGSLGIVEGVGHNVVLEAPGELAALLEGAWA